MNFCRHCRCLWLLIVWIFSPFVAESWVPPSTCVLHRQRSSIPWEVLGPLGLYRSDEDQNIDEITSLSRPAPMPRITPTTQPTIDYSETRHELVKSVNYHISRKCNYSCQFCFHTQKSSNQLTLEEARTGLRLLREAGTEKINFAGGEPFLHPTFLGELSRISSQELGLAVSIISNGSLITPEWMQDYGQFVDVLGVSVDSFNDDTNAAIGRGEKTGSTKSTGGTPKKMKKKNSHADRVFQIREMCTEQDIKFKLNTVVCSLNWEEDMIEAVKRLNPQRWKVFQVLLLKDENMGLDGNLRDARDLVVSREQFDGFCNRHKTEIPQLIPEPNDVMQNSYLLLDENMSFLDCSGGGKVPGESILKVGVDKALDQAGFDHTMFQQRGGIYNWKRERKS